MFNKNKKIKEPSNTIRDLEEIIKSWIKVNDVAKELIDTQSRLATILYKTIEMHKEKDKQNEEIIKILKETIELYKEGDKLRDKRIEQLLEQSIGLIK